MSPTDRDFHLIRFVEAQDPVYAQVCSELKRGHKTGHWMWFIFPQIAGLGNSEMSRRFAIGSVREAEEYLKHPVLGARLRECADLVLKVSGKSAYEVFGTPDDMKFRSCMTLFSEVENESSVFEDNIRKYFGGMRDKRTLGIFTPHPPPNDFS
jgi:uncharacterized protein (DUF1810 family)